MYLFTGICVKCVDGRASMCILYACADYYVLVYSFTAIRFFLFSFFFVISFNFVGVELTTQIAYSLFSIFLFNLKYLKFFFYCFFFLRCNWVTFFFFLFFCCYCTGISLMLAVTGLCFCLLIRFFLCNYCLFLQNKCNFFQFYHCCCH